MTKHVVDFDMYEDACAARDQLAVERDGVLAKIGTLVSELKHIQFTLRPGAGGLQEEIMGNSGEGDTFNVTLASSAIELGFIHDRIAAVLASQEGK